MNRVDHFILDGECAVISLSTDKICHEKNAPKIQVFLVYSRMKRIFNESTNLDSQDLYIHPVEKKAHSL